MDNGEGMVAIVRASEHAGLNVTLLPDRRKNGPRSPTRLSKSNIDTSTEKMIQNNRIQTDNAIYPSCNQIANDLHPSQLPRASNSPFNWGSGELCDAASETIPQRNKFVYHGKGPIHFLPFQVDFAESLRKYPSMTNSSELIRKLLNYTHAKHHARRHSKSTRSPLRKTTSQQMNRQTKKHENYDYDKLHENQKKTGKKLKHSVSNVGKRYSSQDEQLRFTYDYLKNASLAPRKTDVRYFSEVQKALKHKLCKIIDGKPKVCDRIQERYNHHVKHCRGYKGAAEESNRNIEMQTSPKSSRRAPSYERSDPIRYDSTETLSAPNAHKVCFCQHPKSCKCETKTSYSKLVYVTSEWIKNIPVYPNFSEEDKSRQAEIVENLAKSLINLQNESNFNLKAKKEILKNLDSLPMWHPADIKDDILFKEELADMLLESLDRSEFSEEVKNIMKGLKLNSDYVNTAESIINKLIPATVDQPLADDEKENLKLQVVGVLKTLPAHYNDPNVSDFEVEQNFVNQLWNIILPFRKNEGYKALSNFDEAIVDDIQTKILDWCNEIPELNIKKDSESINNLAKKIAQIKLQNLTEDEVRPKMQKEIKNWLDKAATKNNKTLDSKTKNKFIDKLMESVHENNNVKTTLDSKSETNDKMPKYIFPILKEWIEEIPGLPELNEKNNQEALLNLLSKLKKIQIRNENFINNEREVKEVILNWLQRFLKENDIALGNATQENLVNKLVSKLKDLSKETKEIQKFEYPQLYDDLLTFLNDIPGLGSNINYNDDLKNLVSDLHAIANIKDEKVAEMQTRDAIKDFVQTLSSKGTIDIKENDLLEIALGHINSLREHRKSWNEEMSQKFLTEIFNALDSYLSGKQFEIVQEKILEDILKNISAQNSDSNWENILRDITYTLTQETDIPTSEIKELCNKITASVKKIYAISQGKPKISTNIESDPLFLDKKAIMPETKEYTAINMVADNIVSPTRKVSHLSDTQLSEGSVLRYEADSDYCKNVKNVVHDWLESLKLDINNLEKKKLESDIITDIVDRKKYLQLSDNKTSDNDELEHLKYQIFRRLGKLISPEALSEANSKVIHLHNIIKSIKVPEMTKKSQKLNRLVSISSDRSKLSDDLNAASKNNDDLIESLKQWLDTIPSYMYQTQIGYKLIQDLADTINRLKVNGNFDNNLKFEISQWLPKLFSDMNEAILNDLVESLRKHLLSIHITDKTTYTSSYEHKRTEKPYKEKLCETISNTLPSLQSSFEEPILDFTLLKERLAEAFINLHYFSVSKDLRDKFKEKLLNEVNKFCDEYLKRHPESPLNTEELCNDLYSTLKKVSVPNIESIRSEIEQVRLKEEIFDWIKDVPLKNIEDIELELNNMVSDLALRLYEIENDKSLQSSVDKRNKMEREIENFLKQLSLDNDKIMDLKDIVDQLVGRLDATDMSRTFRLSNIPKNGDEIFYSSKQNKTTRRTQQLPSSTLSAEDHRHLERIRKRSRNDSYNLTQRSPCEKANICKCPPRQDVGIQAMGARVMETIETSTKSVDLHRNMSPQVIIREYYWDSNDSNQSVELNNSLTTCGKPRPCSNIANDIRTRIESQNLKDLPCIPHEGRGDICCNCGERILPKCRGRPNHCCRKHNINNSLRYCSKQWDRCPHPTCLFFKNDF